MENSIRLIWQCEYCNDVVISYSHLRHDMNVCECGKSAVDLEDSYQRVAGKVKNISRKKLFDKPMTNEEIQRLVDEVLPKNFHTIDERIFALRLGKAVRDKIEQKKALIELTRMGEDDETA